MDEIQRGALRVLLIRHGRTANIHRGGWIDGAGMQRWRDDTDAVGIAADTFPSSALVDRVATASLIVASDLQRAIESAKRLAPGREIVVSPLFHESNPDVPTWVPLRWPLLVWRTFTATQWVYRILRGTDSSPELLARTAAASKWLADLSGKHDLVAVVCHRYFRRLLDRQLVTDGWTRVPGPRSHDNWSCWEYEMSSDLPILRRPVRHEMEV